jgi:hypothetical protein
MTLVVVTHAKRIGAIEKHDVYQLQRVAFITLTSHEAVSGMIQGLV